MAVLDQWLNGCIETLNMAAVLNKSDITGEMLRRRTRPCPPLRDIVESIWIQDGGNHPAHRTPSTVLPTGTVEILFHYGDLISHLEPEGAVAMPRTYVTGQRSRPVSVVSNGHLRIVIVSLFPWGLSTLFPGGTEASDGYVDLKLLLTSKRVTQLEEQLALANGVAQRVRLVESFLREIRHREIDRKMAVAAQMLCGQGSQRPIQQASSALEISERHLSRQFKAAVGLQPSVFMRIMRFQRVIRARRRLREPWAAIAADCGYSDQAHLIRDVREFSGQAPGQIILDSGAGSSIFNGEGASDFFDTVYM